MPVEEELDLQIHSRPQLVLALGEGQDEGQAQVVLAHGVAEVEPDARLVRAQEPAAHDPGHDDGGGHVAVLEPGPPDEARVDAAPRSPGVEEQETRPRGEGAGQEGGPGGPAARPLGVHDQMISARTGFFIQGAGATCGNGPSRRSWGR